MGRGCGEVCGLARRERERTEGGRGGERRLVLLGVLADGEGMRGE